MPNCLVSQLLLHPPIPGSTYALVVDDLDDSSEAAGLQLQDAADLDAAPGARSDLNLCHCDDF